MPSPRSSAPPSTRRTRAALVGTGLVVLLALTAAVVRPDWTMVSRTFDGRTERRAPVVPEQNGLQGVPSAQPRPDNGAAVHDLSWLRWVALGLLALVLVAVVVRLLRWWLDRLPEPVDAGPDELVDVIDVPVLQRGAAAAEEHLIAGGDPTDAIIAAWMALEQAAQTAGVTRRPAQTSTEFTADILQRTGIDAESVDDLRRLYLRARFAAGGAGPDDLQTTRRLVRRLADSWREFAGYRYADGAPGRSDGPAGRTT